MLRVSLLAIIAITSVGMLQRIFDTTGLSFNRWCICVGVASSLVAVDELIKLVIRHGGDLTSSATAAHPLILTPATT